MRTTFDRTKNGSHSLHDLGVDMKRLVVLVSAIAILLCGATPLIAAPRRPIAVVKGGEVYVTTATGSSRRITRTGGRAEYLAWLPSGKRVLFSK